MTRSSTPERERMEVTVEPQAMGMSPSGLAEAIAFAQAHECDWPESLFLADGRYVGTAYVEDRPPHDRPIGVVRPRGRASGIVLRAGVPVARWGDTARPDTTFSVAKSYLAVLAGIAHDDGLIGSVDEPVADRVPDEGFADEHNRRITWRHLLQQTSEWRGVLWGIPDSVDHHRQAGPTHDNAAKGTPRRHQPPGSRWEYNDVRVNRLALSLLRLFRRPLPEVLRERVMDPIGASRDWEWHGYENSVVEIDGRPVRSVSGGGHWGGGLFVSSEDHARVGLLIHRGGDWNGTRVLSRAWIDALRTPCPVNPLYGYLWWLNTGRGLYASAPERSVFAIGGGQHLVWLDDVHDLVVVARWVAREHCDGFIDRVLRSVA